MPLRAGGAVTMQVQEPRGRSRIDQGGFGSVGEGRKGKDKEEIWDVPKSREVKRLEEIVADLRELQQGDGKVRAEEKVVPDCFCQGALVSAMYRIAC
jgi:hypothetical protein